MTSRITFHGDATATATPAQPLYRVTFENTETGEFAESEFRTEVAAREYADTVLQGLDTADARETIVSIEYLGD